MSDQPIVEQRRVEQDIPAQPQEGFIPVAPIETQETQKPVEVGTATSKATLINPQIPVAIDSSNTTDTSMAPANEWRGYGYTPMQNVDENETEGDKMANRVFAKSNGEPPTE